MSLLRGTDWIFNYNSGYLTAEARLRLQASPCKMFGGQSGTGTRCSPSTSVFPCRYHYTNYPYPSSHTCCCYQKDKGVELDNRPKRNDLSELGPLDWKILSVLLVSTNNRQKRWLAIRDRRTLVTVGSPRPTDRSIPHGDKSPFMSLSVGVRQKRLSDWPTVNRNATLTSTSDG